MATEKKPTYRTPAGIGKFVKVNKPDTQFKKEGEYSLKLLLPADSAEATTLKNQIDAAINESVKLAQKEKPGKKIKRADAPYKLDTDKDGSETGNLAFSFKAKAQGERKDGSRWTFKPMVFDAKGQPMTDTPVWSGSKLKVAYQIRSFYTDMVGAGISLNLQAVQVLDLVTAGERNAASFGFEEEDGYESTPATAEGTEGAEAGAGVTDGSDF